MKKILSLLLTAILPVVASAYDAKINGIYYNFEKTGNTATVTYYSSFYGDNKNAYSGTVNIPASVTCGGVDYSVTSIGWGAFYGCIGLTSVTIPNSVMSIGDGAFYGCIGLTSVTIPNSVTRIGNGAFESCSGLTSVTIPNSVTTIGSVAFYRCSGLTSPLYTATLFAYMPNSYSGTYNIPNGIKEICGGAFSGCSGLTSVTIPNSVKNIGSSAFYNTGWYNNQPEGMLYLDSWLIDIKGEKPTGKLTINEGTKGIAAYAFYGCSGLTSVEIPNSVTSIGGSAFSNCSGLTSVTIPNSVTSIGNNAFANCPSIMTVKSYINKPFNVIGLFANDTYRQGTLYIPAGTKDLYNRFDGWREFQKIVEMEKGSAPNGQCTKPSIIIAGKDLRYECETPGAEFESILATEEQRFSGGRLVMENKDIVYILTVYATAPGYDRSEPAQVKFVVSRNDVNQDGTIDVADIATVINAMTSKSREEKE